MGYITFNKIDGVTIYTTTRQDGVSLPPYDSFNMSFVVGDKKEDVEENRSRLCKDFQIKDGHLIVAYKGSKTLLKKVTGENIISGKLPNSIAFYTFEKDVALGVTHSDSIPLFFHSKELGLNGVIQLSKIETLNLVTTKVLKELKEKENVDVSKIEFYLAPSITFSHVIINDDLRAKVAKLGFSKATKKTDGVLFLDLIVFNVLELRNFGVPFSNIHVSEYCTFENSSLFFSETRDGKTGKMMSVIKFN